MSRRDLIDPECRVPLDGLLEVMPGGFNAIPDIVQRRAAVESMLGAIEVLSVAYLASSYRDAFVFAVMILILIFRPQGLFGVGQVR